MAQERSRLDDSCLATCQDRKKLRLPDQLDLYMEDATDRKITLVLCKDLSRLGRNYIEADKYTDFVFPPL